MVLENINQKRQHTDGFSFGMRGIKGDSCVDSSISYNPGVGEYEVEKGHKALQKNSSLVQFKASQRFQQNKNLTPGPGSYNPQLSLQSFREIKQKKKNHHSFTNANRTSGLIFDNNSTPNNIGPGYYLYSQMNDTFFNSTSNSVLHTKRDKNQTNKETQNIDMSFVYKIRGLEFDKYSKRKHDLTDYKLFQSPPVGSYQISTSRSQDSFVFSKGKRNTLQLNNSISPGPAKYNLPINSQLQTKSSQITTMSTSKRFFKLQTEGASNPGPGYYLIDGLQNSKFKQPSNYSFGKQEKNPYRRSNIPAPGHYKTFTELPKHAAKIGTSKRPPVGNGVPGIGTYQVAMTLLKNKNQNKQKEQQSQQTIIDSQDLYGTSHQQQNNQLSSKNKYKDILKQQKKALIEQSPNLGGKQLEQLLNDDTPLYKLRQMNTPSPAYYDNLLQVVKKQPIKFPKGNRKEEFLDVFNVKLPNQRSPGPAMYKSQLSKSNSGANLSTQVKRQLFNIINNPGVGRYDLDEGSFSRYATKHQSTFSTKHMYTTKNMKLPSISRQGQASIGYQY